MRSTLSPAFTSSKIRAMVPFMIEVGDQMISVLKEKIKYSESEYFLNTNHLFQKIKFKFVLDFLIQKKDKIPQ